MEKQLIDFAKIKKLVVKVVSANIKIFGQSSENYVAYESQEPSLEYKDDTLVVSSRDQHFLNFGFSHSEGRLELAIPVDMKEISVGCVSSDVTIRSIRTERLMVRTVSGDVLLEDVVCSDCQMKTVSGDMTFDSPAIEKLVFSSVSGDLTMKNLVTCDSEWIITTTSGDISFETVGIPNMRLTMRTASGDLNTNVGYTRQGRDYLFGDGRMRITANTTSGDVQVKATNRAERSEGIEKKILRLVASGKLTYEQAKQILDELS
ncbi:DUF4097 family beta strand repeat-containing protein [Pseudothermotoga sp. U03pept]|uniref:DUF4097 family beta strand repeat-containing protein n=1 Tax=Pseudothermotoga sp. U03pept TaxID=3447012 RepID=UPI003F00790A